MNTKTALFAPELIGSQAELAKALGVRPPTVNQWVMGIRPVPINKCLAIEQITNGRISRKDLRPNDWHLIWADLK